VFTIEENWLLKQTSVVQCKIELSSLKSKIQSYQNPNMNRVDGDATIHKIEAVKVIQKDNMHFTFKMTLLTCTIKACRPIPYFTTLFGVLYRDCFHNDVAKKTFLHTRRTRVRQRRNNEGLYTIQFRVVPVFLWFASCLHPSSFCISSDP
jgi:hypothetical protein